MATATAPVAPGAPVVYQLKVVLRGVSPMIWRRLLVRSDSTIADLHATLQLALGWSDEHLHRFVIHGKDYGISRIGGLGFSDDPHRVQLADLGVRLRERFLYEYDFGDGWQHDLRVEAIQDADPRRRYPVCVGGRRAAPPEDCGGPWTFQELRQRHHPVLIARRLAELLGAALDATQPYRWRVIVDEHRDELTDLLRWAHAERFDRRQVNQRLRQAPLGTPADRSLLQ